MCEPDMNGRYKIKKIECRKIFVLTLKVSKTEHLFTPLTLIVATKQLLRITSRLLGNLTFPFRSYGQLSQEL